LFWEVTLALILAFSPQEKEQGFTIFSYSKAGPADPVKGFAGRAGDVGAGDSFGLIREIRVILKFVSKVGESHGMPQ
jgi:hypothetical protein